MNEEQNKKILTVLSMNGRAPAKLIGQLANVSSQKAYRRVKELEDRLGIKYLAEVNVEALGYLKFIILVRFTNKLPISADIRRMLEKEVNVQFGAVIRGGDYNLLLYVLAENIKDISFICSRLRRNTILANYQAEWYVSPFYESYGFMPLRTEFIDTLKEKLITSHNKRTENKRGGKQMQILQRELSTLRELNNDGSADLLDIDKKYNFDTGRTQYAYYKLLETNILKRITITMPKIPIRYIAAVFVKVIDQKLYYESRKRVLEDIISYSKLSTNLSTNKYSLVGDITTPFGILSLIPILEEPDFETVISTLGSVKGAIVNGGVITNTLIGKLCYRAFDNAYAEQTEFLEKDFNIKAPQKINYLERQRYYGVKASPEPIEI